MLIFKVHRYVYFLLYLQNILYVHSNHNITHVLLATLGCTIEYRAPSRCIQDSMFWHSIRGDLKLQRSFLYTQEMTSFDDCLTLLHNSSCLKNEPNPMYFMLQTLHCNNWIYHLLILVFSIYNKLIQTHFWISQTRKLTGSNMQTFFCHFSHLI
jgi:hypothetical protein